MIYCHKEGKLFCRRMCFIDICSWYNNRQDPDLTRSWPVPLHQPGLSDCGQHGWPRGDEDCRCMYLSLVLEMIPFLIMSGIMSISFVYITHPPPFQFSPFPSTQVPLVDAWSKKSQGYFRHMYIQILIRIESWVTGSTCAKDASIIFADG